MVAAARNFDSACLDYNGNDFISSAARRLVGMKSIDPSDSAAIDFHRRSTRIKTAAWAAIMRNSSRLKNSSGTLAIRSGMQRCLLLASKVFRRRAKATCSRILSSCARNVLRLAVELLLFRADEVARNGALRKILRPEVFPSAPLQF